MIEYRDTHTFTKEALQELFLSVEWSSGHFPDKLQRAVLLRRKDKLYSYQLERLEILSEEDWTVLCRGDKHPKPAMWQPSYDFGPSLFGTEAEALRELRADPKIKDLRIQIE